MIGDAFDKEPFSMIAQEASKICTNLQLKGQAENVWRVAVKEKQSLEQFSTFWKEEKSEKLAEMCEMKGVEYDSKDEAATIDNLYERLKEDLLAEDNQIKNNNSTEPNSYAIMAAPVIERSKLLLRMRPAKKTIEHPTAESPNPFAIHRDKPSGSTTNRTNDTDNNNNNNNTFIAPANPTTNTSPATNNNNSTAANTTNNNAMLGSSPMDNSNTMGSPTMLRSSSYYPKTQTTISKEAKKARVEQNNKAFNRRVKELRKWLQAFKSWKQWHEGVAAPTSPIHAVSAFVQSSPLTTQELEELLQVHVLRARSRIDGLRYYHQLLGLVSFAVTRHQLLGSLGAPLCNGGM